MKIFKIISSLLLVSMSIAVKANAATDWTPVKSIDVEKINADIKIGIPTVDVGIYYANNHDKKFIKYAPLDGMIEEFMVAKKIYAKVGMNLNLLFVKTGRVDPKYFSIQTNELDKSFPHDGFINMYEEYARRPDELTDHAKEAFEAIIEPAPTNDRTLYLVSMQGVYMPYYQGDKAGRVWTSTLVRTKGLSFPTYIHGDTIPRNIRGVITLSHHDFKRKKTIAHELGHKLINVSHEYLEAGPTHESFKDGGLMLYGIGTDIPSGKAGRWHKERLHLSPFVYRMKDGQKVWNADYKANGNYYDPLYGDKVIHFESSR